MSVERPVIAIAGIGTESSTFSPGRTALDAFALRRDEVQMARYPFLAPGSELREAVEWHPTLVGRALPGGTVTREAFETMAAEIEERLAALPPLDGLWFDIHGAMSVEGLDDAEAVLLDRIRAVIGAGPLVSTSMDLHGNVSRRLAHQSDLITCYRTAPHVDTFETCERAVRNLVDRIASGKGRPVKAWVPVPVLLAGEQTSTRVEPAKSLYDLVPQVEAVDGVIDAAIWIGYAWADEPRNRATVVVTGDDEAAVAAGAERLAAAFWAVHDQFDFVGPTDTFEHAVEVALASADKPFFVSDSGDNPTAGGSGDMSWGLARLLEREDLRGDDAPVVIYASVPGPAAVAAAVAAGVGATVTVTAGAAVDDVHEGPVTFTGVVHAIHHGDKDARTEVVIRRGGLHAILTERRKPYHHEHDFTDLDLKPREADVVVVKIGYLEPELFDMSADWILSLSPGGVDQDVVRLGHHRISRPMHPFDAFDAEPDLSARIIAASDAPLTGADE